VPSSPGPLGAGSWGRHPGLRRGHARCRSTTSLDVRLEPVRAVRATIILTELGAATIRGEVAQLRMGSGRHERIPVLRVPRARPAADREAASRAAVDFDPGGDNGHAVRQRVPVGRSQGRPPDLSGGGGADRDEEAAREYDLATSLLRDLQALAERKKDSAAFRERFLALRAKHERKPSQVVAHARDPRPGDARLSTRSRWRRRSRGTTAGFIRSAWRSGAIPPVEYWSEEEPEETQPFGLNKVNRRLAALGREAV
jgi:hypothetical protein